MPLRCSSTPGSCRREPFGRVPRSLNGLTRGPHCQPSVEHQSNGREHHATHSQSMIREILHRVLLSIDRYRRRRSARALVLAYHRIAAVEVDPWELCVTAEHFAEHLDVLQQIAHPISLRELVQAHKEGRVPDRAVAVTFDDGYADNLHTAKPLLEQYTIPATVFVASGYVGQKREFWWDELGGTLLRLGALPEQLTLSINGEDFQWALGEAAEWSEGEYQNFRGWIVDGREAPSLRHSLYLELHQLLQPLREVERRKVMDDLRAWSGVELDTRPPSRPLSLDELPSLAQGELIEVGSHTVTHPFLSALPERLQLDEMRRSKAFLEEHTGRPVTSLAYPYGNYAKESVKSAREAGFDCACSTVVDCVWRGSDRYQLPRAGVENVDGEAFAKWLSQMLNYEMIT